MNKINYNYSWGDCNLTTRSKYPKTRVSGSYILYNKRGGAFNRIQHL